MFKAENINFSYENKKVISSFSLTLEDGDSVSILSSSGTGKSTLSKILSLYLKPNSGSLILDNVDLLSLRGKRKREVRRKIQLVFQNPYSSFDPLYTIEKSINEFKVELDWKSLLSSFSLDKSLCNKKPSELSGGEIQRFALLRSLSVLPKVLILDEVTSDLDPLTSYQIISLLNELKREFMFSSVFFTNDSVAAKFFSKKLSTL